MFKSFHGRKSLCLRPECLRGPLFALILGFPNSQTPDGKSPMLARGKNSHRFGLRARRENFQVISERAGQTYPGNDNAFMIHWV